jgi:hypothetical protein
MTYEMMGASALNYAPCRYGVSRILFRGPQRRLDVPYVAFLGGTETYGKFIKTPFPALVESTLGVNCINFGVSNAGVDVFLNDVVRIQVADKARATVLQVVGAQNLSNRFYSVHPRRNDRFVSASPVLSAIYPEVDFSEFHFTRHMLSALHKVSPERFEVVRNEVRTAWSARMKLMLGHMTGPVLLLWFADRAPQEEQESTVNPSDLADPLFITRGMIEDLAMHADGYVEVVASRDAIRAGTTGMVFSEMEEPAARHLLGPRAHGEAAVLLAEALQRYT